MAEKFGIGSGPHELKIGKSFTGGRKFQTIRYDFKPASVDTTKKGLVEIGESNSLSVKVPHSNSTGETHYNGHLKHSSQKECVLIIDRNTGEITLEKLSGHMLLKKTRQERPEKSAQIERLVNNSSASGGGQPSSSSTSLSLPTTSSTSSSSRPQTPISTFKRDSPAGTPKPLSRSASPHVSSSNQQQPTTLSQAAASVKVDLSESSSDSSSSGSDSESDFDEVPSSSVPFQQKSAAANPSMPSFLDIAPSPPPPPPAKTPTMRKTIAKQSTAEVLNDDLQLSSESDDDSD